VYGTGDGALVAAQAAGPERSVSESAILEGTSAESASGDAGPTEAITPAPDPIAELEAELIRREQARQAEFQLRLAELDAERAKLQSATARLGTLAGELVRTRQSMVEQLRTEAGELLLSGARRLAGESLRAHPDLLAARASELAIQLGSGAVRVRVSPTDSETLTPLLDGNFSVIADPAIEAGCFVESAHGAIDGSLPATLEALRAETQVWRRSA
jgi:flagellar biosynthesis/type III secretory pathway protein FliH